MAGVIHYKFLKPGETITVKKYYRTSRNASEFSVKQPALTEKGQSCSMATSTTNNDAKAERIEARNVTTSAIFFLSTTIFSTIWIIFSPKKPSLTKQLSKTLSKNLLILKLDFYDIFMTMELENLYLIGTSILILMVKMRTKNQIRNYFVRSDFNPFKAQYNIYRVSDAR